MSPAADVKTSALSALTTPATGDLLRIVDVSDTSSAATGTTKKITLANFSTALTPSWANLTSKPTTLSGAGITNGAALDTLIAASVAGTAVAPVIFANAAARTAATPSAIGQLALQTDTAGLWQATALTTGSWASAFAFTTLDVTSIITAANGAFTSFAADAFGLDKTVTAAATVGAQTINKPAGTVNFAAAATSLVVTNSLVDADSIILATVGTNDTTMKSVAVVAAAGSFTLHANAAATAETRVNFIVIN